MSGTIFFRDLISVKETSAIILSPLSNLKVTFVFTVADFYKGNIHEKISPGSATRESGTFKNPGNKGQPLTFVNVVPDERVVST